MYKTLNTTKHFIKRWRILIFSEKYKNKLVEGDCNENGQKQLKGTNYQEPNESERGIVNKVGKYSSASIILY